MAKDTNRERLDGPDDATLLRDVLDGPDGRLELGRVGVGRHGNVDLDVVGRGPPLELGLGLDHVLDPRVRMALNDRLDPNQRLHVRVEAVRHQLKLAIGRDERDGPVVLEPAMSTTTF